MNKSYVYFLTNKNNTVIYIGVTSDLEKRIYQHKSKTDKGFTSKYNCDNRFIMRYSAILIKLFLEKNN